MQEGVGHLWEMRIDKVQASRRCPGAHPHGSGRRANRHQRKQAGTHKNRETAIRSALARAPYGTLSLTIGRHPGGIIMGLRVRRGRKDLYVKDIAGLLSIRCWKRKTRSNAHPGWKLRTSEGFNIRTIARNLFLGGEWRLNSVSFSPQMRRDEPGTFPGQR
ncbi:hypothetical protein BV25DRAFT_73453 [Artomyces pyxidatus]|uniref:Uncharacterized protein n=1 Tax=Artomyces pyxidatus TaxID=48021 RepID=A0ACB8TKN4_9AGAM|nr:hypothetical protein BV25DRAFT_73453 [Artomyces pyxidatus]